MRTPLDIGSDGAKEQLDIAVQPGGAHGRVSHDAAGLAQLVPRLDALAPALVVLEASGGDERPAMAALRAAGLPVALVHPRQTRDCAKATGTLAQTDRRDAHALARFAQAVQPPARPTPAAEAQVLAATVARRRPLLAMLTAEQHRLRTAVAAVRPHLEAHSAWLRAALADIDADLERQRAADPAWRERAAQVRSAPGVGRVLARPVVAEVPALGRLDRRQLAALVGVAPRHDDSGTRRGQRTTWGGRAPVRSTVSMATLSASRFTPVLAACSQRVPAHGTPKAVALVACLRTRLTILNAMVRQGTAWAPPVVHCPQQEA